MKLLIVGGSGFLSGTLARIALAAGHEVWAVTRGQRPVPAGVTCITVDRKDRASFADQIQAANTHWDLVADCICFSAEDAVQDIEVFTNCCEQLVFISTDFVYQPHPRPYPVSEVFMDFAASGYGLNKHLAEETFIGAGQELSWTILRPGHIYGPGSQLGCLPEHGRDPDLLEQLKQGSPLRLVGGGHFLQQPIFAADLARMILDCAGKVSVHQRIFNAPGSEVIPSWYYYQIISDYLGVSLQIEEVSITAYLDHNPDKLSFCCHRAYTTDAAQAAGLYLADTPIIEGLQQHIDALL